MKRILIDRPDLQTPLQRAATTGITLLFWIIWIYLWLPLVSLLAWLAGIKLFRENIIDNDGYKILFDNIGWYALIILLIAIAQIGWSRYNLLRFRDNELRKNVTAVDNAALSHHFNIDARRLPQWQTAKQMEISLNPRGDLIAVDTNAASTGKPGDLERPHGFTSLQD